MEDLFVMQEYNSPAINVVSSLPGVWVAELVDLLDDLC